VTWRTLKNPTYLSSPRVETPGIGQSKRTDRHPTNATKLCSSSPDPGDNTADKHHPEREDIFLRISVAALCESVLEDLDGGEELCYERNIQILHPLAIRFDPTLTGVTVCISDPKVRSAKTHTPRIILNGFGNNVNPNYRDEREIKIPTTKALGKSYGAEMAHACISLGAI